MLISGSDSEDLKHDKGVLYRSYKMLAKEQKTYPELTLMAAMDIRKLGCMPSERKIHSQTDLKKIAKIVTNRQYYTI